ncbi:MAG: DNA cytosine methyltransferase [Methanobrevibacter sp.]|nr:DNA cytosine methyltransferase [Methanobrevibacter sp.]
MTQGTLFDFPQYQINKKIRLIELFGGIGSQAMALEELGIDFETYKLVEFDKYAIKSYNAIHNTNFEVMDIRNVHGKDLEIREREIHLHYDLFFPLHRFVSCGQNERNEQGRLGKWKFYPFGLIVGSRTDFERITKRRTSRCSTDGKCSTSTRR